MYLNVIFSNVDAYLVLHGASGLNKRHFEKSIECGIRKINIFNEIGEGIIDKIRKDIVDSPEGIYIKMGSGNYASS